ncbi:N-acyl-L-amino acid amidohydrolase [Geomicrobium sp. JCM 19037]|uniref:M20 metallopeptidase family protein n=1 Tax=Geomicrobium sp. JCM 19037 TaxID=1460634 RepID=UPI00045F4491|nr:M20 family metallopeptidase [Geomicrobium sp. JCM 19037]GAK06257.1 N-acyl-L-amino acid amidohydrolase [Geomicrobium sp. JCM 19037]
MNTRKRAEAIKRELITWRRQFHQHPELGFEEFETRNYVEKQLQSFGLSATRLAKTGLTVFIPGKSNGPTVGLRADMDALPMQEANEQLDYRSKHDGIAHMCGHDAHTAMLLGAAKLLADEPPERGNVKLLFQPAEEGLRGAERMIQDGALDNPKVEAIAGTHVYAKNEIGTASVTKGLSSGAVDVFSVKIIGKGGHAAHPYLATDPITITAEVISSLQQIVSRHVDPLSSAVLSITRIHGGSADNVIPNEVVFGGTVRTLEPSARDLVESEMHRIVKGITEAFDAQYEMDYRRGFPSVYNDPQLIPVLEQSVENVLGSGALHYGKPSMGGEDFSYYTEQIPGTMFRLGVGNKSKNIHASLHSPNFNIDEDALPLGSALLTEWAYRYLAAR